MKYIACIVLVGLLMVAASMPKATPEDARAAIDAVLTDFHDAADKGDFDRYFGNFTNDAIFFGTDPDERWTVDEFKGYAREPFADGHGWTYHLRERNIFLAPGNQAAWFDEIVESDHYGKCRGTGVLVREGDAWKISQYNLVIPVPNDFADQVVAATRQGLRESRTIFVLRHAEKEAGDDPGLTDAGRSRVLKLQLMLESVELGSIYSSDYRRTRETARPFARTAGLEVSLYDPSDAAGTAKRLRDDGTNGAMLVVGHSNTVPDLLRALGLEDVVDMSDREYGHLFIVRLDELGWATMTHLHY